MHRIETRHELIFERRTRPLESDFSRTAKGKWLIYLASEYLRHRNWKALDSIGRLYLKRVNGLWYVGKFKKGELYETLALPVIDEERSKGDWLAIVVAGRRTRLPFRAYAKEGSWDYWKRFDVRHERQGVSGALTVRGHRIAPCDSLGGSGEAVASGDPPGFGVRPSDSGLSTSQTVDRCPGHREDQAGLASEMASVEGWETRGSADTGMPFGRTSQEN